jgi:sensor domain CHASE-containing protein
MDKSSKRKSIYRRLFITVTLTVLLLNIILAIITIQDSINIQIKSENNLRKKIRNEIIGISDFQT